MAFSISSAGYDLYIGRSLNHLNFVDDSPALGNRLTVDRLTVDDFTDGPGEIQVRRGGLEVSSRREWLCCGGFD